MYLHTCAGIQGPLRVVLSLPRAGVVRGLFEGKNFFCTRRPDFVATASPAPFPARWPVRKMHLLEESLSWALPLNSRLWPTVGRSDDSGTVPFGLFQRRGMRQAINGAANRPRRSAAAVPTEGSGNFKPNAPTGSKQTGLHPPRLAMARKPGQAYKGPLHVNSDSTSGAFLHALAASGPHGLPPCVNARGPAGAPVRTCENEASGPKKAPGAVACGFPPAIPIKKRPKDGPNASLTKGEAGGIMGEEREKGERRCGSSRWPTGSGR